MSYSMWNNEEQEDSSWYPHDSSHSSSSWQQQQQQDQQHHYEEESSWTRQYNHTPQQSWHSQPQQQQPQQEHDFESQHAWNGQYEYEEEQPRSSRSQEWRRRKEQQQPKPQPLFPKPNRHHETHYHSNPRHSPSHEDAMHSHSHSPSPTGWLHTHEEEQHEHHESESDAHMTFAKPSSTSPTPPSPLQMDDVSFTTGIDFHSDAPAPPDRDWFSSSIQFFPKKNRNNKHKDENASTSVSESTQQSMMEAQPFYLGGGDQEQEDPRFTSAQRMIELEDLPDDLAHLDKYSMDHLLQILESKMLQGDSHSTSFYVDGMDTLLVINPCRTLNTNEHTRDRIHKYASWGKTRLGDQDAFHQKDLAIPTPYNPPLMKPPPHVYTIADQAYRHLTPLTHWGTRALLPTLAPKNTLRRRQSRGRRGASSPQTLPQNQVREEVPLGLVDQAVLITGGSGSGKTTVAKLLVEYLAHTSLSHRKHDCSEKVGVLEKGGGGGGGLSPTTPIPLSHRPVRRGEEVEYTDATSPQCVADLPLQFQESEEDTGSEESLDKSGTMQYSMEERIMASSQVLESFGNGGTDQNDDSSRFGQVMTLHYGPLHSSSPEDDETTTDASPPLILQGAHLETYLLEKSRLTLTTNIHQTTTNIGTNTSPSRSEDPHLNGHRRYRVFYEVLAGLGEYERDGFWVRDATALDFDLTVEGEVTEMEEGGTVFVKMNGEVREDAAGYRKLRHAMSVLGFTHNEQENVISVICALLHFSNLSILDIGVNASKVDYDNPSLPAAMDLLGISAENLNHVLCSRCVVTAREMHIRSLPKTAADRALSEIVATTYGALFQYLVERINASLEVESHPEAGGAASNGKEAHGNDNRQCASITVVDTFGFENLNLGNSFQQLLVNYSHEIWCRFVHSTRLAAPQVDYIQEEIGWTTLHFPDNEDVLDLLQKKQSGILPILDEHCTSKKAKDGIFAADLYQKCTKNPCFGARQLHKELGRFVIHHFAGSVEYECKGFVKRNRDELPGEATNLFMTSSNPFVRKLGNIMMTCGTSVGGQPTQNTASTAGKKFTMLLRQLRSKLAHCNLQHIRCVKPNSMLLPGSFDRDVVAKQLEDSGLEDVLHFSRARYHQSFSHFQFFQRYRVLIANEIRTESPLLGCEFLFNTPPLMQVLSKGCCIGKSKIFLSQAAFLAIERERLSLLHRNAVALQACWRCYYAREEHSALLFCAAAIQRHVRRFLFTKKRQRHAVHEKVLPQTHLEGKKNLLRDEFQREFHQMSTKKDGMADGLKTDLAAFPPQQKYLGTRDLNSATHSSNTETEEWNTGDTFPESNFIEKDFLGASSIDKGISTMAHQSSTESFAGRTETAVSKYDSIGNDFFSEEHPSHSHDLEKEYLPSMKKDVLSTVLPETKTGDEQLLHQLRDETAALATLLRAEVDEPLINEATTGEEPLQCKTSQEKLEVLNKELSSLRELVRAADRSNSQFYQATLELTTKLTPGEMQLSEHSPRKTSPKQVQSEPADILNQMAGLREEVMKMKNDVDKARTCDAKIAVKAAEELTVLRYALKDLLLLKRENELLRTKLSNETALIN